MTLLTNKLRKNKMAQIRSDSLFTTYLLTEAEQLTAKELSPETKMYVQNLLAEAARDKVALALDPESHVTNVQKEAYYRGQMEAYMFLLASHEYAVRQHNQAVHVELNPDEY